MGKLFLSKYPSIISPRIVSNSKRFPSIPNASFPGPAKYTFEKSVENVGKSKISIYPSIPSNLFGKSAKCDYNKEIYKKVIPGPGEYIINSDFGVYVSKYSKNEYNSRSYSKIKNKSFGI